MKESPITQYLKLKQEFIAYLARRTVGGGTMLIGHNFFKNGSLMIYRVLKSTWFRDCRLSDPGVIMNRLHLAPGTGFLECGCC